MSFIRFIDSDKTVIIFLIILYFFVGSIFAAIIQDHQAAVPADPAKLLAAARKRMDKQEAYCEGNRNNYVYRFACLCNRLGVPAQNLVDYCTANFADLSSEECNNAVASACNNREEYNTLPQKVNGKKVEMIQQYLSEYFMLRKNVVRGMIEYREKRKRY